MEIVTIPIEKLKHHPDNPRKDLGDLRWSDSPHDAWRTRDLEKVESLARQVGGITMLFNPAAGQLRVL